VSERIYHLVGVAGVGMSALAEILLACGVRVTGSDRYYDMPRMPSGIPGKDLDVVRRLIGAGVTFFPQDGDGVGDNTDAVVVSTAIEPNNPDLVAACARGVEVRHRVDVLADLVREKRLIAVTGTSGKSTVTGMVGWILEQLGGDPSVVNGAAIVNWLTEEALGSTRRGDSDLWVVEADESDRSLLRFNPDWTIITNASADHFDLRQTLDLFGQFESQTREGVINGLDKLRGFQAENTGMGSSFDYGAVRFSVNVPGLHNAENALLAVMLCEKLGYPLVDISTALASFRGIHRRLEQIGSASGVEVIDDYAHNPEKIRAAWKTVADRHARVTGIWRPHGYGPLSSMMDALAEMFGDVCRKDDRIYLLPVYDVGGTANRSVTSDELAERLAAGGVTVSVREAEVLPAEIAGYAAEGDGVLVMGARDPELPLLARKILSAVANKAQ